MAKSVLTIVFEKAEQKLDTVIAAAANELTKLGHTVKEVRVMGDSGEAKVALNQVEGIVSTAADTVVADAKTDVAAVETSDTVGNKNPDGTSPVSPIADVATETPADVPVDGAPEQTVEEKRLALLEELDALDKEEEAAIADPTEATTA
jgi:predicted HAD superfamily phosphohydrolase